MMKRLTLAMAALLCGLCLGAQTLELRLLNHWDNPNGTVERGFAGRSLWAWDELPTSARKPVPAALRQRLENYGRLNQQFGINGTVLNNVNAKPLMLTSDMIRKTARIADILRPYGLKVYLAVNFASPKALGDLATADPLEPKVQEWWQRKATDIYRLIPDFGGFLVKANSEGEPGPMDYGRSHVDGANMLADALQPHGGIVMWRAFVYAAKGGDRASQALEEFIHLDGQFRSNVIIQIKNGPIDFQPREPISPLFFGLKHTKMMVEFQLAQEYTGQSIHTCFLPPMWHEFYEALRVGNHGQLPTNLVGVAAVANTGDAPNWTGNDLSMANWYAFGRMANDLSLTSRTLAEDFLRTFFTQDDRFVRPVAQLLLRSREAVVDYMMPLGLHHIFAGDHHYGPEPWYAPRGLREDWLPPFYHRADSLGLGFNRTDHDEPCVKDVHGSNNVSQYPDPLRYIYNNVYTCPEPLLLWFHHVSWDHVMQNGLTLWENLCYTYDRGVRQADEFVATWEAMRPYFAVNTDQYLDNPAVPRTARNSTAAAPQTLPSPSAQTPAGERYEMQLRRFKRQAADARWWRDACLLYFQQFSHRPLPPDSPAPTHKLDDLMRYKLRMDMYTAADMDKLP